MREHGYVHRFEIDPAHAIHIYRGSLTGVEADALVSSDDNYLTAGGGVSAALAREAGRDVARERLELVRTRRPALGDVVRTSAGALPCRLLYHAVTIDFDNEQFMDESVLRRLVANLLKQAERDGVRTLGMPALGTGAAWFDLARAAEVILEELLDRLPGSAVHHVILALVGDTAQTLFYEQLIRSGASRAVAQALRRQEAAPPPAAPPLATVPAGPGEKVEQFPSLVDADRLAATAPDRPKLVTGLAGLILEHAEPADVEQELLSLPCCHGFQGPVEQRLMEFLYLSEKHLRLALGAALFRTRDLRTMLDKLGEPHDLLREPDQLVDAILRALCFNLATPPVGIGQYLARVQEVETGLGRPGLGPREFRELARELGLILEGVLRDLVRLYGVLFFGPEYAAEMVRRNLIPPRRDEPLARLPLGNMHAALQKLQLLADKEENLRGRLGHLGRPQPDVLPRRVDRPGGPADADRLLQQLLGLRNRASHDLPEEIRPQEVRSALDDLRALLLTWRAGGYYPEVVRYEGTYENRDGERFVYFVDEQGRERKVRTDDPIDPRRHYYCFAHNNPIHIQPTLVPKL